MIGADDLANRFTYHPPPTPERVKAHVDIRNAGHELASLIDSLVPDSREKSLAVTAIEEAVMWANAGLARRAAE